MATIYRFIGLLLCTIQYGKFAQTKPTLVKPICDVSDGTSLARFDFSRLSNSSEDHVIRDDNLDESIRLQLCGPLVKPCNIMKDYSVCLVKGTNEIGIGKSPPVVVADSGVLEFKFTGDDCKANKTYTVDVIMKCDNEDNYRSQPELIPHKSDNCSFYFLWRTKAACSEEFMSDCKTIDENGQHYDLAPLMLKSENYVIPVWDPKATIILNVCHSIVHDDGAACEGHSGTCLREVGSGGKYNYRNLGDVDEPPKFENGVLTLRYDNGEPCTVNKSNRNHVETVISFECDYHATTDTRPTYMGGGDECSHKLLWRTAAACSVEALKNHSAATAGKCTVTNPLTNFECNLQDLMEKGYRRKTPNGVEYIFQVCGSVVNSSCPIGTGGCLAENGTSTGMAKTKLMWSQGGPYLNYTDGAMCGAGHRYTVIAFFCGAEGSSNGPMIMEDEDCALIIHWNTPLACEKRIKCETQDGTVSLKLLIRSSDNYVVKTKDTEFHINVCRPLVPKPYLTCLHGSAACQVIPEVNGQFSNETSIGYPDDNPLLDEDEHVILRYTGGSPCPEDSRNMISSNLTFICDYTSSIGEPIYKYYQSCTHVFEWTTSVVCGRIEGRLSTGCVIENPRLSYKFELAPLRDKLVHSVKSLSGGLYNISLCAGEDYCNGSPVCKNNTSYGLSPAVIFDYNRNMIVVKFVNGTKCGSGLHSSEVQFVCDEAAGNGEPTLIWVSFNKAESRCSVAFEWRTKVFCIQRSIDQVPISGEPEVEETAGNVKDTAPRHVGAHVGIAIFVAGCVALIICLWSSERRARMRACCRSLTSRREHCRAQYTKVNATEEARLLLDIAETTQCHTDTDSDDELLDA